MKIYLFKTLLVLFYVGVLVVNFLANSLPLNNRNTGAISDSYPSLFTPSGFTFSIWGVIYILLGVFVVKAITTDNSQFLSEYSTTFIILFITTCVTNILWLFLWHYDKIALSTVVMAVFLVILLIITFFMKDLNALTKITFSIYAGWITIAFIANITIMLVKLNIPLFQNKEMLWYVIVMIVGVLVGLAVLITTKNIIYVAVFAWAYFGIFMKHLNQTGYHLTTNYNTFNLVLLLILIVSMGVVFFTNNYKWIQ